MSIEGIVLYTILAVCIVGIMVNGIAWYHESRERRHTTRAESEVRT